MHTLRREILSAVERNSIRASFANPSTGGAVTRTLEKRLAVPRSRSSTPEVEGEPRIARPHLDGARQTCSHELQHERLDEAEQDVDDERSQVESAEARHDPP